jgi:dipeptidyl aminopeptidase/acylaminoacyl peptidase
MQTDVSDGLAELAREGIVDPKRACIVGGSYGGYAALAGVTVQHGIYRCAVSVAGVADLGAFMDYERDRSGTVSSTTRYWDAFMGPGSGFAQISPLKLAAGADAPILLVHGKDDTVVPFDQSTAMQRALAAAHKPVEFVVLPGEDHWLSREATRSLMLKSAVAFVEKYNPSDPTP